MASKIRYRPLPPQEPHVGEAFPLPEGYKRILTTLVSVNAIRIRIVRYFQLMAFPLLAAPALSLLQCVEKILGGLQVQPHPYGGLETDYGPDTARARQQRPCRTA